MPYRNGTPLEVTNLWVLFYFLFCIFLSILQLLRVFKKDKEKQVGEHHKGSSQQAYSGRHYQRRQAKNLFRK